MACGCITTTSVASVLLFVKAIDLCSFGEWAPSNLDLIAAVALTEIDPESDFFEHAQLAISLPNDFQVKLLNTKMARSLALSNQAAFASV